MVFFGKCLKVFFSTNEACTISNGGISCEISTTLASEVDCKLNPLLRRHNNLLDPCQVSVINTFFNYFLLMITFVNKNTINYILNIYP